MIFFDFSSVRLQSCRNLRVCKWMPPSDWKLPMPQSRDRTGLQLLWSWLFQPPTRCRMWKVKRSPCSVQSGFVSIDITAQLTKPNLLLTHYFPAFFFRCKCSPIGSSSIACHPITGQCVCRAGVEGRLCESCRVGFFGFSSRGCRGTGLTSSGITTALWTIL